MPFLGRESISRRPGIVRGALEILRRLAGSLWIRALVSVALLALVFSQIDLDTVRDRLAHGHWGYFAAAVAAVFVSFLIAAFRWHLFLRAASVEGTLGQTTRAYLLGSLANNFLPSQFGGDVTRAWMAGSPGTRVRAAATVVVDRVTALGCIVLAAWIALAVDPGPVPAALVGALAVATAGLAAGALFAALIARGARRTGRLQGRIARGARDTIDAARACLRAPVLVRAVAIGLVFQGLVLLSVWLCSRAISLEIPFSVLAVTVPAVLILSALPVSIGGFGVREGGFVVLLGRAGVSSADATVLSLLTAAASALASVPAVLLLLRRPDSRRAAQTEDREHERREEDLEAGDEAGGGEERDLALPERAGAAREPVDDDDDAANQAGEYQRAADE